MQRHFEDKKKVDKSVYIRVRKWTEKMSLDIRVKVLMLSKPGSIRPPMEQNLAKSKHITAVFCTSDFRENPKSSLRKVKIFINVVMTRTSELL
jgi:hypothetical protein